jgi:hypothetical protein
MYTKIILNESDNKHKHFGQWVTDKKGNHHIFYRKEDQHALTSGATIFHRKYNPRWHPIGNETEIVPSVLGFDAAGQSAVCTQTGRIVLIYSVRQVPLVAPSSFRVLYFEDGDISTVTYAGEIFSINNTYTQAYGRIRKMADGTLVATPYYKLDSGDMRIPQWESTDDGETWTATTNIFEGPGYNETEIIETELGTLAFARGGGIRMFKSVDGRNTYTYEGLISNTDSDCVAPTIDKFKFKDEWWLLLGYCDRAFDKMVWRRALVKDVFEHGVEAFDEYLHEYGSDYLNASGYQSISTRDDDSISIESGIDVLVFKEFTTNTYSQVRIVNFNPLIQRKEITSWKMVGLTVPGNTQYSQCDGYIEYLDGTCKFAGRIIIPSSIDVAVSGAIEITSEDLYLSSEDPANRTQVSFSGIAGVSSSLPLTGWVRENSRSIRLQRGQAFTNTLVKGHFPTSVQLYFNGEYPTF